MSFKKLLLMAAILLNGTLSVVVTAQEHQHHEMGEQTLQLNHGVKWSIDASLHTGMANIRQQLMLNLDDIHYDKFSNQQFLVLASEFDKQLQYLFENCQLPAQADVQLHVLLAKIMHGNELIKNSENKKQGAIMIMQALQDYPVYFDDVNWQEIVH
jgi:sialic acid synthase SpsE